VLDQNALRAIPDELQMIPQWVAWSLLPRNDKPTKFPINCHSGRGASTTDPETWTTFASAVDYMRMNNTNGIGFVFTAARRIVGIDIDKCRDRETGMLNDQARELVDRLDSYTEVTQSQTGLHIIVRGRLPANGRRKGQIEMYESGRFFVMTGAHLLGTPAVVEDRSTVLLQIHDEIFGTPRESPRPGTTGTLHNVPAEDQAIIRMAMSAGNGEKFQRLFNGDVSGYPSQSEADAALCSMIAFWVGPHPDRIDRVFRHSRLFRPEKWGAREDYRRQTIEKALEGRTEFYSWSAGAGQNGNGRASSHGLTVAPGGEQKAVAHASNNGPPEPLTPNGNGAVREGLTDPHRLARRYVEKHTTGAEGAGLRAFQDDIYRWTGNRYEVVPDAHVRGELSSFCKRLLNQDFLAMDGGLKAVPRVTQKLVADVLGALKGEILVDFAVEMPCWLVDSGGERRDYFAMRNGLLDVSALLAGQADALGPHSPRWFSTISLPYDFDPHADCPRWRAFLDRNLARCEQKKALLQEFAGYLLLPNTDLQKFLMMTGSGSNGKSVVATVLTGLLGKDNVSAVPLEAFGQRFQLATTLGKLANIVAEVGEFDKVAEAVLKQFVAGDQMCFERKYKSPFLARPTARLVLATNNPPRFCDKSEGVWRRVLLLPFTVEIPTTERIRGMDKTKYWQEHGEFPGVLNWALDGLRRLRQQNEFTIPESSSQALAQLRLESDPCRRFLLENYCAGDGQIPTIQLYQAYESWCECMGHAALSESMFGRQVFNTFPKTTKRRMHSPFSRTGREAFYVGISKHEAEDANDNGP
jgi:P4 family phage/plasmid primase-like protien